LLPADVEREENGGDEKGQVSKKWSFHEMKRTTQTDSTDNNGCQEYTST